MNIRHRYMHIYNKYKNTTLKSKYPLRNRNNGKTGKFGLIHVPGTGNFLQKKPNGDPNRAPLFKTPRVKREMRNRDGGSDRHVKTKKRDVNKKKYPQKTTNTGRKTTTTTALITEHLHPLVIVVLTTISNKESKQPNLMYL